MRKFISSSRNIYSSMLSADVVDFAAQLALSYVTSHQLRMRSSARYCDSMEWRGSQVLDCLPRIAEERVSLWLFFQSLTVALSGVVMRLNN